MEVGDRLVVERGLAPGAERERLDAVVLLLFEAFPSRSAARKACKRGEIAVDGEVRDDGGWWVDPGQAIQRLEPDPPPHKVFPMPLEVVFEDAHLAVVLKPPGLVVNGNRYKTLEHALPANLSVSTSPDALPAPRPVHRLDRPTGGLVVCAKTRTAQIVLGRAFQERRVTKRYRAIAVGRLEGAAEIAEPVDERSAVTRYRVVSHCHALRSTWLTTVDLHPVTGRTHQLRRHLAGLGHPILGDTEYGVEGQTLRGKGLFLWAVSLVFEHPVSGQELSLSTPEPPKFESLRTREERRWRRYHPDDGDA